jgi:hypothetical protein
LTQYDAATEKQLGILKLITFVLMVMAPVLYLYIAWQLDTQGLRAKAGNDLLLYLLLVISILSPLVIPVVTSGVIRAERARGEQMMTPAQLFQKLCIIQMSMIEAIYIYGFVVYNITGTISYMLYFYPIGIAWSFVYWPKREKYERLVEKLNQP